MNKWVDISLDTGNPMNFKKKSDTHPAYQPGRGCSEETSQQAVLVESLLLSVAGHHGSETESSLLRCCLRLPPYISISIERRPQHTLDPGRYLTKVRWPLCGISMDPGKANLDTKYIFSSGSYNSRSRVPCCSCHWLPRVGWSVKRLQKWGLHCGSDHYSSGVRWLFQE